MLEMPVELQPQHPAVRAWCEFEHVWIEPGRIDTLKDKRKSSVYRLHGIGPGGTAIIARRCRPAVAEVQRMIYEEFLPRVPVPVLQCYGFLANCEYCWLFLEEARGELYSQRSAEHRRLAGQWLGEIHLAPIADDLKARLPDCGLGHYRQRLHSCRATLEDHLNRNQFLTGDDATLFRRVVAH